MQAIEEIPAQCPYCGEPISLLVEYEQAGETHIEDCEVCCRPMRIRVSVLPVGDISIEVMAEFE